MISFRTKVLLTLSCVCLVDIIIPLPLLGLLLIYVVLEKPVWFPEWVGRVYSTGE